MHTDNEPYYDDDEHMFQERLPICKNQNEKLDSTQKDAPIAVDDKQK